MAPRSSTATAAGNSPSPPSSRSTRRRRNGSASATGAASPGTAGSSQKHLRRIEVVRRENGTWAIVDRIGAEALFVETGHLDRTLVDLDLASWRSSKTLSPISRGWLRVADRLYLNMTQGRKRRGGDVVTREGILELLIEQGYSCPISGSYFTHDAFDGAARSPYQPSIDRKECSRGYDRDNIRIVCLAVNMGMSDWGEEAFVEIARRVVARGLRPDAVCSPAVVRPRLRFIPCEATDCEPLPD